MSQLPSRLTAIVAATAVAGISGAAIAGAATSGSSTPSATPPAQAPKAGPAETPLTGDTKAKVEAAALARVPGTVIRTETDSDGVYESHIRKSDGTEVEVKVGKDFTVTSVQERPAGGGRRHGGPGGRGMHADLAAVAKDLGVSEADLTKALQAARPQPPANGARPQPGAGKDHEAEHRARETAMYAAIAKALGKDAAAVRKAFEAHKPARP